VRDNRLSRIGLMHLLDADVFWGAALHLLGMPRVIVERWKRPSTPSAPSRAIARREGEARPR
jgi:hypothetical protein